MPSTALRTMNIAIKIHLDKSHKKGIPGNEDNPLGCRDSTGVSGFQDFKEHTSSVIVVILHSHDNSFKKYSVYRMTLIGNIKMFLDSQI